MGLKSVCLGKPVNDCAEVQHVFSENKYEHMKISNETKIGALTTIAVVFLILGFNFLKGKSVLKTGFFLYAKYSDLKKLGSSNPVYANGLQIGTVYSTSSVDP